MSDKEFTIAAVRVEDMEPLSAILSALRHARKKHPGALTPHERMTVLTEEVGEVAQALNDTGMIGCREAMKGELAQVAAVCIRMMMGE